VRFSVIIPAYNAEATIAATVDAVLAQTVAPHQVLVYDDGSADRTRDVLAGFGERIRVLGGENRGVSHARNSACAEATGDVVAFVDADDIWHPRYLEVQQALIARFPDAIAYFTDHVDLIGGGAAAWPDVPPEADMAGAELLEPAAFMEAYNAAPMQFNMSWFCMPVAALRQLGPEPFPVGVAEDTYLHNLLPLLGKVAHTRAPLVAYRIQDGSLSANKLKYAGMVVDSFGLLATRYEGVEPPLARRFRAASASRRRDYAKFLMGAGRAREARREFVASLRDSGQPRSVGKSVALLTLTLAPRRLQPSWPTADRV
jgi:glycosyltransferase involved in cell wall biosynthesis